ncbi:putative O-methyltransferase [Echria macrotheca]|uniref:O-methyltransferase n=1 Tax=Echria macrotheca TaxID=438768 RepID=A0AAJ0BIR7_9PEZI|nr:putative O-methyltransferase [Echria macrotheca]
MATTTTTTTTTTLDRAPKPKVSLTGPQSTLLITLHGRALDAQSPNPILADHFASQVLSAIDHDFTTIGVGRGSIYLVGARGSWIDTRILAFLSSHPTGTSVIHLGCGLDTRAHRLLSALSLDERKKVRWIDLDLEDVIALRRVVAPPLPSGTDYAMVSGSATNPEVIKSLPADRPTVIVMEGLTSYLDPVEGEAMIATLCAHFGKGEIIMDASNWLTRRVQRMFSLIWKTGSDVQWVRWGIDPRGLEKVCDGLRLEEVQPIVTNKSVPRARAGPVMRVIMWMLSLLPVTRNTFCFCRYTFGR